MLIVASSSKRTSPGRTTSGKTLIGRPMKINSLVRVSHSTVMHTLGPTGEDAYSSWAVEIAKAQARQNIAGKNSWEMAITNGDEDSR